MEKFKGFITERKKLASPSESETANWIRDHLSGTQRVTTKDLMRNLFKSAFSGSTKIFDETWDNLIDDGFLVKVSGNKFKWEL